MEHHEAKQNGGNGDATRKEGDITIVAEKWGQVQPSPTKVENETLLTPAPGVQLRLNNRRQRRSAWPNKRRK
jgi:hypothetical protein